MPANLLGPADLARTAERVLTASGATVSVIEGAALAERYPVVHAVGAGSRLPPAVVVAQWAAEGAGAKRAAYFHCAARASASTPAATI